MTGAGELRRQVAFAQRATADDGYGNTVAGDFADAFTLFARLHFLVGSEAVMAARLAGKQPAVITVRDDPEARQVRTEWRATDVETGEVFNVRAVTPNDERSEIDFLVEAGVGA